ncbi:acidic repeat-containing protein-like [Anneissia japonica]|uniref:acidic repeat-containing protein-like n=1 Tax=Anneissia japonica TaxID=1529436 RepID=UPI001425A1C9|nr:acidic repeat-containing protein-like [Anneissia japonica]
MAEGGTTTIVSLINMDKEGDDDDINALYNRVANKLGWLEKQIELQDCSSADNKRKKTRKYSRKKQPPNKENIDPDTTTSREHSKVRHSAKKSKSKKDKEKDSEIFSIEEKNGLTPLKASAVLQDSRSNTGRHNRNRTNQDVTNISKIVPERKPIGESKVTNDLLDQDLDELYDSDVPLPNVRINCRKNDKIEGNNQSEGLVSHLDVSWSVSPVVVRGGQDDGPSPPPNALKSVNLSLDDLSFRFNKNINISEAESSNTQNYHKNKNTVKEYHVIESDSELNEDFITPAENHLSEICPDQNPNSSQKCKLNESLDIKHSRSISSTEKDFAQVKFTESPEPMKWLLSPSSQVNRPIKSDVTDKTNTVLDDSDDDCESHRILSLKDRLKSKWKRKTGKETSSEDDKQTSETKYRASNVLDSSSEDEFESFLASIRTPSKETKANEIVCIDDDDNFLNDNPLSSEDDDFLHVRLSQNIEVFTSPSMNKTSKEFRTEAAVISFDTDSDDDDSVFITRQWPRNKKKFSSDSVFSKGPRIKTKTSGNSVFTNSNGPKNTKDISGNDSVFKTPIGFLTPGAKSIKRKPKATTNSTGTFKTPGKTSGTMSSFISSSSVSSSPPKSRSFLKSLSTPYKGTPSSSPYINNFKSTRDELIRKLFIIYNDTVFENKLPSDFKITWNKRMRKTAGFCYYSQNRAKNQRFSRIELSEKVCDSAERLRDTLIHELCHAAAWLIHGVSDGHGKFWKYWAAKANIAHPEIPIISRCHSYVINTKYKYDCSKCGYTIGRHSKSLDTSKYRCGCCRGELVLRPQLDKSGKPVKPRAPSKFAQYVKENYGVVKKDNDRMKHADIMRVLSQEFSNKAKINESC